MSCPCGTRNLELGHELKTRTRDEHTREFARYLGIETILFNLSKNTLVVRTAPDNIYACGFFNACYEAGAYLILKEASIFQPNPVGYNACDKGSDITATHVTAINSVSMAGNT